MKKQTCESCRWYDKWPKQKNGFCHRYPPQFIGHTGSSQAWPEVNEKAFCGEYKPKKSGK